MEERQEGDQHASINHDKIVLDRWISNPPSVEGWKKVLCDCGRMKRFYCPTCLKILAPVQGHGAAAVPKVVFPPTVEAIDLVLADYEQKASGIQAKVLAPSQVNLVQFPEQMPDAFDYQTTVVVFPSEQSVSLDEISYNDLMKIKRFIFIECRWWKSQKVMKDERILAVRHVKIKEPPTQSYFWRYHFEGNGALSTIEAMFYLMRDLERALARPNTGGSVVPAAAVGAPGPEAQLLGPPPPRPRQAPLEGASGRGGGGAGAGAGAEDTDEDEDAGGGAPTPGGAAHDPRLENLLFLFAQQYGVIQHSYKSRPEFKDLPVPMSEASKDATRAKRSQLHRAKRPSRQRKTGLTNQFIEEAERAAAAAAGARREGPRAPYCKPCRRPGHLLGDPAACAYHDRCYFCGEKGHWGRNCMKKKQAKMERKIVCISGEEIRSNISVDHTEQHTCGSKKEDAGGSGGQWGSTEEKKSPSNLEEGG